MDSEETIKHFRDMGVHDQVVRGMDGKPKAILAHAVDGYAHRCMKDFRSGGCYYLATSMNIFGLTTDDVFVVMTIVQDPHKD